MLTDYICLAISSSLLLVYHSWFLYSLFYHPGHTITGWAYKIREQWVLKYNKVRDIKEKQGGDILAVQTARNWIIVSTFLATIAITISFTIIQLTINISQMNVDSNRLQFFDVTTSLLGLKAIVVVSCNLLSFFVILD
jgi:hypothetical protein